ncbi:hypothetical protein TNCV_40481 [Trichonephila clavipes]|nr:hypothetical protein TNCV_40481 [Trichonephila clavipes]
MCTKCSSEPASPAHILECLGLTKQDLADDPLQLLEFLKVRNTFPMFNRRKHPLQGRNAKRSAWGEAMWSAEREEEVKVLRP